MFTRAEIGNDVNFFYYTPRRVRASSHGIYTDAGLKINLRGGGNQLVMAWLANRSGTRSEQFPEGVSLTLNWLGRACLFQRGSRRLPVPTMLAVTVLIVYTLGHATGSSFVRASSSRKVKRSAVGIASETSLEIRCLICPGRWAAAAWIIRTNCFLSYRSFYILSRKGQYKRMCSRLYPNCFLSNRSLYILSRKDQYQRVCFRLYPNCFLSNHCIEIMYCIELFSFEPSVYSAGEITSREYSLNFLKLIFC